MTTIEASNATGRATAVQHSALDIATALEMPPPTRRAGRGHRGAAARPLLVVAGAGLGQDRDDGGARRVARRQRPRRPRPGARPHLHPQGRGRALRAHRQATARPRACGHLDAARDDGTGAEVLGGTPTVSTYHAYAGRLVARARACAWASSRSSACSPRRRPGSSPPRRCRRWDGPMDDVVKSESTVIQAVMALAGEMAEHVVTPDEVVEHLDAVLARSTRCPSGGGQRRTLTAVRDAVAVLRERRAVLPIVERTTPQAQPRRHGLRRPDGPRRAIARSIPAGRETERQRFRAVLLDEFQDTSEAQLAAAALALRRPPAAGADGGRRPAPVDLRVAGSERDDAAPLPRRRSRAPSRPADVLPLSTSWRNDSAILDAANTVAAPLADRARAAAAGLAAGAGVGPVEVGPAVETVEEEADALADWSPRAGSAPTGRRGRPHRSGAVPRALPVRRGRRGAAATRGSRRGRRPRRPARDPRGRRPRRALWVVQDPTRGDRLMRLLTGAVVAPRRGRPRRPRGLGPRPLSHAGAAGAVRRRRRGARDAGRRARARAASSRPSTTCRRPRWAARDGAADQRRGPRPAARPRRRRAAAAPPHRRWRCADLVAEAEGRSGSTSRCSRAPSAQPRRRRAHLDAFADVAAALRRDRRPAHALPASSAGSTPPRRGARARRRAHRGPTRTPCRCSPSTPPRGSSGTSSPSPASSRASSPPTARPRAPVIDVTPGIRLPGDVKDKGWLIGLDSLPYDLRGDAPACRTSTGAGSRTARR